MRASRPEMIPSGVLDAILREAWGEGQRFTAWGVAWARVLPSALFVPAFGLGMLPVGLRLAIGFVLAASIAPLVRSPVVPEPAHFATVLLREAGRGLPIAVAASASLWAAVVAGGVADNLARSPRTARGLPLTSSGPFSTLLFLAATVSFLSLGGAERIAERLAAPDAGVAHPLSNAVRDLAAGVDLGVGLGAPLLVAGLAFDVATMIAARELWTLRAAAALAPARSLVMLVAIAALLDRMAGALAALGRAAP